MPQEDDENRENKKPSFPIFLQFTAQRLRNCAFNTNGRFKFSEFLQFPLESVNCQHAQCCGVGSTYQLCSMKVYLLLLVLEQLSANFTYCSIFFSFLCRGELQAVLVVILGKKKGRTCSISHHQLSLQCYLKTCLCVVKIKADTTEGKYTPWKCNAELPDGFEYVVL